MRPRFLQTASRALALALALPALLLANAARASTVWTGPLFTYNQPAPDPTQPTNQDHVTAHVWLTRAASGGLFNAYSESFATNISPADTEWAFGTLDQYASLPYTNWLAWLNGKSPTTMVGSNVVVHLISDDIYLSFQFSFWASKGAGGFTYQRSTAPPPEVTLTNPADGSVFAAPASLELAADASVASGVVTNVEFFANDSSLGAVASPPFNLLSSGLPAGAYALAAVATAGGVSTTSAVASVTVVTPVPVALSGAQAAGGQFSFSYTANAGLSYVVLTSSNIAAGWVPVLTNVAISNPQQFSAPMTPGSTAFYRVGLLPNP